MDQSVELQVVVAGAGPAGLTLAIELARRGVAYRIVDQRGGPFHGSRGKGLQPRTLEVFEDMGVVERILAAGGADPEQWIHQPDGGYRQEGVGAAPSTASEPFGTPWMVMQSRTEAVLRERLGELGGAVEWNTAIVEVSGDATVRTRLRKNGVDETAISSFLIAADGGRSTVRSQRGIAFPGKTLGVRAVVADLHLTGIDTDHWHRYHDGDMGRQLSLCPLQGTPLIQLQAPVPLDGEIDTSPAGLEAFIRDRSGLPSLQVHGVEWVSVYQMGARLADTYRSGNVFLVGDAAHVHPPTGGQGLNTSIQDAYNLGWKLAAHLAGAPASLLDTYEAERRPVAAAVLGISTQLLHAAGRGEIRRGRQTQQLDLGYPDSSLNLEAPVRNAGPRAGDRAPDAVVTDTDGAATRLFAWMRGPHWTLIRYGETADEHPDVSAVPTAVQVRFVDADNADDPSSFGAIYTADRGDWFLIRPDGYLGAIVAKGERGQFGPYLRRLGL